MSMSEQIRRMRQLYPAFDVVFNGGWYVVWQGPLRPFARTYTVRVAMVHPKRVGHIRITPTCGADVTLVSPHLELESEQALGVDTPHLYWSESNPRNSRLCLFDPAADEWSFEMAIAETIIPWTIDWLASYEGWRATGEWTGGGRDHGAQAK